jgi:hypothetical protein
VLLVMGLCICPFGSILFFYLGMTILYYNIVYLDLLTCSHVRSYFFVNIKNVWSSVTRSVLEAASTLEPRFEWEHPWECSRKLGACFGVSWGAPRYCGECEAPRIGSVIVGAPCCSYDAPCMLPGSPIRS